MAELVIQVVPFQESWLAKYAAERERLCEVLEGVMQAIEHIGSTSVRGLDAKPIIDIAVCLPSVALVPDLVERLAQLDYAYQGEYGLAGRHFFTKGEPRAFHLPLVDDSTHHWRRWIAFRDALRRDADLCQDYQRLKHDLARKFKFQRALYSEGKSAFIDAVEQNLGVR
jgi:GrpB-like predicted nucleotidyltransferase (UPF0157 family)